MSLRMRLVLAMSGLVILGLFVAGLVTYGLLQSFLVNRVDQQLEGAQLPVLHELNAQAGIPGGADQSSDLPPNTFGEVVGSDGAVLAGPAPTFTYPGERALPPPSLPSWIGSVRDPTTFTTDAVGDASV